MESAPRNIEVRPLSSSTMVITWMPPETPNGQINGYKVNSIIHQISLVSYIKKILFRCITLLIQCCQNNHGIHKWLITAN